MSPLDELQRQHDALMTECQQLKAERDAARRELERVRKACAALATDWRRIASEAADKLEAVTCENCADELEAVLKGEPDA